MKTEIVQSDRVVICEDDQRDGEYNKFELSFKKPEFIKGTAALVGEQLDGNRRFTVLIRINGGTITISDPTEGRTLEVRIKEWYE